MISEEVLKRYNILTMGEVKEELGDNVVTETNYYQNFLTKTNQISMEILESFVETMTDDKINMGNMIKFFKNIKTEYADVLAARKIAREELKKLKENVSNT